jgi:hypothetical protein
VDARDKRGHDDLLTSLRGAIATKPSRAATVPQIRKVD